MDAMWSDVVDLRDFYETRLGQVARHLLRRRIRQTWPDLRGEAVLGLGYASPFLRQFTNEAGRLVALMPAQQGVLHWPPEGPNATALVDETDLPLPDASMDRVLLAHAVECSEHLRDMLKEVWRVMAGNGRLLVVAPNRRGIWARTDRTPFGSGHPFSPNQLSRLLRDNGFTPVAVGRALYFPPTNSRWLLSSAPTLERIGDRFFQRFAGAVLIEARKQIYAVRVVRPKKVPRTRPVLVTLPQVARREPPPN
jgi:SAM-dependent methyltransferase